MLRDHGWGRRSWLEVMVGGHGWSHILNCKLIGKPIYNLSSDPLFLLGREYGLSGTCWQGVGRAYARFGIIPTQLLSNPIKHWGIWLSTGVYGSVGGPEALPAYLLNHYIRSRY